VEYPAPSMIVDEGKIVDTEKYIVEHYNYLNVQARKERENHWGQARENSNSTTYQCNR